MAVLISMLVISVHEAQAGFPKRAVPSAMYFADYEGSAAFAGGNMNSFVGYEGEWDTVYINPNRGARSPFSYRNWSRRMAAGSSAINGGLTGFGYSSCPIQGSYEQEFIPGCCGEEVIIGDCCDPCIDVVPAKRSCSLFSGLKSLFSFKTNFCCSKFARDPWYACDPCCFDICCDPCFDPCCGFGGNTFSTACCGVTGDSNIVSDGALKVEDAAVPKPGAAPTPLDTLKTEPAPKQGVPVPKSNQISVPSYPSVPAPADQNKPAVPSPLKSGSTGVIKMAVPEDSIVYINGYRTKMKGSQRSFNANNLEDGQIYRFEVRVVAAIDGRLVEEVKETTLIGGLVSSLAFMQNTDKVSTVALK